MSLLIGVDLGTSETKAGLFDLDGQLLRLARCGYPILAADQTGRGEQDPQVWWDAVCRVLRQVTDGVPAGEMAAICIEGQGPCAVLADVDGQPVRNALLWIDTRVDPLRRELAQRMGAPVSPFAHVPQALWLWRHAPSPAARWLLTAWDWVAFRLTGRAATSTLASFHPFPPAEREAADLPERLFAPQITSGQVIGQVTEAAAEVSGLPAGLPVVAGIHDGMATFIGAGLVEFGRAADVNGASGGLALCWSGPIDEQGIFSAAWIDPGQYIVGGAMAALGYALDWVCDLAAGPQPDRAASIERAATTPPGTDGLIFLPYLAGERSPIWDPLARGVFFGLTLSHTHDHLVRAVLESVAFALRHLVERLEEAGARTVEIRACGGQARSPVWNQIKADVIGVPVSVPHVPEAALMGAAVLAGVGVGSLPDVTAGAKRMVQVGVPLQPEPARHRLYDELFQVYRRLYPDLRGAFHQLGAIQPKRNE